MATFAVALLFALVILTVLVMLRKRTAPLKGSPLPTSSIAVTIELQSPFNRGKHWQDIVLVLTGFFQRRLYRQERRNFLDAAAEPCTKAVAATAGDREPTLRELSQLLRETTEH